ncbi:MAG: hypothetical protein HC845_00225 [Akkermansiaceae bacterium]|nr:hypothetical protein [Akkermansiaceae bacterium]
MNLPSMKHLRRLLLLFVAVCFLSPHAFAIADKDADGMSDIWEGLHGFSISGNANPSEAPTADPDGDGVSNLLESIAGTNPLIAVGTNAIHRADIFPNTSTVGTFNLQWNQLLGKEYRVFRSTSLEPTSWVQEGIALVGTNSQLSFNTQLHLTASKVFWRVEVADIDPDSDKLSSWEEGVIGTQAGNPDSDGDNIFDGYEYRWGGLTGLNAGDDLDIDGLSNLAEFEIDSNPLSKDTDNDGTWDATEEEQNTSPTASNDSGSVRNGLIRLRVGTGTLLGPTYPISQSPYPVYPINIYKRDLATGAETLLHSIPSGNNFVVQNIDLPNDGSVYSLQVALPFMAVSSVYH